MDKLFNYYDLLYYFIIYAMLGWCVEVVYAYIKEHRFVNRGFLNGPFCPIYGVGVVSLYLSFQWISQSVVGHEPHLITVFLITTFLTTFIELATGSIMNNLFHTKWWDYSERKFNYQGYICLEFALIWGVAGTALLLIIQSRMVLWVAAIPKSIGEPVLMVLMVYFIVDGTWTIRSLIDFRSLLTEMEAISLDYVKMRTGLVDELMKLMDEISDRLKNGVEKKTGEASARLRQIQDHIKVFQRHEHLPENPIKAVINELMDEELRVDIKSKFELKRLQENYEKLANKLSRNRLYNAFPDMNSKKYREILREIRARRAEKK